MIRFIICLNLIFVYLIFVGVKLYPRALVPASGWLDYFMLGSVGLSFVFACVAVARAKDFEL